MSQYVVCALYKFVALDDYQEIRQPLTELLEANNIRGTLLLASEGINGTVAGKRESIDALLQWFKQDDSPSGCCLQRVVQRRTTIQPHQG